MASVAGEGLPSDRRRYWNPRLQQYYNQVRLTPKTGAYEPRTYRALSDPKLSTSCTVPQNAADFRPLTAEVFERALKTDMSLFPERPPYATLKTRKRKLNNTGAIKTLPPGHFVRSYKVRLHPTKEQKKVLKHWFACGRTHYNTAVDIINSCSSAGCAEKYVEQLNQKDEELTDEVEDAFFWFQLYRAEHICGSTSIGFKDKGDEPGLRSMVREVLTMPPNPEMLAPGSVWTDRSWTQDAPKQMMANCVEDAIRALQTNLLKWQKNNSHHFKLQFRSHRNLSHTPTESIRLDATRSKPTSKVSGPISSITGVPSVTRSGTRRHQRTSFLIHLATRTGGMKGLGPIRACDSKRIADWIVGVGYTEMESELLWDKREDKFYILLKRIVQRPAEEKPLSQCSVIGFDPGARVFQAYSCADGRHGSLLVGARRQLRKRRRAHARLQSAADHVKKGLPHRGRRKYRRIRGRLRRRRLRDARWMKHMHYEAIRETLAMGDLVICPILNVKDSVKKENRPYGKDVAADMYQWSHYQFRQRIFSRAQTMANKHVLFVHEPGTTKTCDACGHVNDVKGTDKLFKCHHCAHTAGRDIGHASRGNILAAIGAALNIGWDGIARGQDHILDQEEDDKTSQGEADAISAP